MSGADESDLAAQAAAGEKPPEPEPVPESGESSEKSTSQDPDSGSGGRNFGSKIRGALLETEPDESPSDYPELPDYTAHLIIGVKKVVNHLSDGDLREGTPAIENFARAGLSSPPAQSALSEVFDRDGS